MAISSGITSLSPRNPFEIRLDTIGLLALEKLYQLEEDLRITYHFIKIEHEYHIAKVLDDYIAKNNLYVSSDFRTRVIDKAYLAILRRKQLTSCALQL